MKKREGKVGRIVLIIFAIISLVFLILTFASKHNVRPRNYELRLKASQICYEAMQKIKQERLRLNIPIDIINDPNETGIIGEQYTPITIDRTDLSSVLTSTNPNFAAVMIELLSNLKIKDGDTIAVGIDGSYPALNLALFSALRVMNIKPIIISTLSSAMWGANHINLTWLDMEQICRGQGIFTYQSIAATLGGEDDNGRGFSPEARDALIKTINKYNIKLIHTDDLSSNIKERLSIYHTTHKIKAFINIGRSIANLGEHRLHLPTGLIRNKPKNLSGDFVILTMLENKVPVINITDANRLASKYHLPIAPIPLPPVGKGSMFVETKYSQTIAAIFAILLIIILYFVIRYDLEYYLTKKTNNNN